MSDTKRRQYPEEINFPEHSTPFGTVTFDFVEEEDEFIVAFSPNDSEVGFYEGAIYIKTNPLHFDLHKEKLLRVFLQSTIQDYKSGAELQNNIITQLRLIFEFVILDPTLANPIES